MKGFCFLKILLLYLSFLGINNVQGNTISKFAYAVANRVLMTKSLPFEDCGSKYLILYLKISSCNSIPCVMRRGTTVSVNVLFEDEDDNTSYIKHRVRWIFNAIKTQAEITPDPCDGEQKCLMNNSEGKYYWASLLVNSNLPVLTGTMLWEAVNEYNEDIICFKVPVAITT